MKKNIIFDLDGTLIDSMPVWDNVGRDFLVEKGITPPDNLEEIFETMSFEESAQYFIDVLGLKMTVKEIINYIVKMVEEKYIKDVPLKKNAYEFLKRQYQKGAHMSILTASEKTYVIPCLERLGIKMFFENIFTCTELGMSKSSSNIYDFAAEKCGYKKQDTAVFEDAAHAVKNAKEAGFFVVGVFDRHEEGNVEKIKAMADMFIYEYGEIKR